MYEACKRSLWGAQFLDKTPIWRAKHSFFSVTLTAKISERNVTLNGLFHTIWCKDVHFGICRKILLPLASKILKFCTTKVVLRSNDAQILVQVLPKCVVE